MSEGKFDHFPDTCHLLSATSNIIITNIVEFFLVFSIDGLAFSVEHSIGRNDTELFGFSCHDFELDGLEVASDNEKVSLLDRSVGVLEVRDQECFGEITSNAFDGVFKREDVNFSEIGDISSSFDLHNIAESHSKIFTNGFVHSDFSFLEFGID